MTDLPLYHSMSIRMTEDLAKKLKAEAEQRGITRHALALEAIKKELSTQEEENVSPS